MCLRQEQEGEFEIAEGEEEEIDTAYWEQFSYGLIDGTTANFNYECRDAMKVTINASFRINDYKLIYKPTNSAKLQLAVNNFTNGSSAVYNYCDFNHLYKEFAKFGDYNNWEQYINFGSRVAGSFVSDIPRYNQCIAEGKSAGQGYDVGLCRGATFAMLLDTKL